MPPPLTVDPPMPPPVGPLTPSSTLRASATLGGGGGIATTHTPPFPHTSSAPSAHDQYDNHKETEPATSFLLQLTSAGPQVQSAFPADPSKRLLDPDQERWFIQYISKDLLNLETVAGHSVATSGGASGGIGANQSSFYPGGNLDDLLPHSDGISSPGYAAGSGMASPLSSSSNPADLQWVKASELPQLGIAAVTLYFIMFDFDEGKHCFAAVIVIPNISTYKGALSAIYDRLKKIHSRVTSIFHGEDGIDDGEEAAPNTAPGTSSNIGKVSRGMEFSQLEDELGGGAGAPHQRDDHGRGDNESHRGSAATTASSRHPRNAAKSNPHVIRLTPELYQLDRNYYDNVNYCGVGSAEEAEYHDMWGWELTAAARDVGFWVRGNLNRQEISLQDTVFGHTYFSMACATTYRTARDCFHFILTMALSEHQVIIRGSDAQTINEWLSTIALFAQDDKLNMASRRCFEDFVIPDLSIQGTTLERKEIVKRLLWFQSLTCIIDLDGFVHGGWTTMLRKLHARHQQRNLPPALGGDLATFADRMGVSFNSMPTLVNASTVNASSVTAETTQPASLPPLEQGSSGTLPTMTTQMPKRNLLAIKDGQAPMGAASFFLSQEHYFSGMCVYAPVREGRRKRYSSFKDWRDKQIKLRAYLQPSDFMSRSVNFKSVSSTLVDTICARVIKAAENNCHVLLRESYACLKEREAAALQQAAHAAPSMVALSTFDTQQPSSSSDTAGAPLPEKMIGLPFSSKASWTVDDELEHVTSSIRFSVDQWRRTILLRALSFYVCEEEFRPSVPERDLQLLVEKKRGPEILRLSDGDHHLMLSTVEPLASVGAKINDRVQRALADNLKF